MVEELEIECGIGSKSVEPDSAGSTAPATTGFR